MHFCEGHGYDENRSFFLFFFVFFFLLSLPLNVDNRFSKFDYVKNCSSHFSLVFFSFFSIFFSSLFFGHFF